jgi:hypothetical protein
MTPRIAGGVAATPIAFGIVATAAVTGSETNLSRACVAPLGSLGG